MRWGFAAALLLLMASPPAAGAAPQAKRQSAPRAAQAEGRPAAEVLGAWAVLQARSSEPVAVTWDPRSGTPQSLFGRLSEAAPGESDTAAARRFLAENSELFRLSPVLSELALSSSFESPMGSHVTFRQLHQGIPVAGAEVKVHFNRAGEIVAVNNTSVPGISLTELRPSLRGRDAVRILRNAVPDAEKAENYVSSWALVIYGGGEAPALAWEVTVSTGGPTWHAFIDASAGDWLSAPEDINRYVDGTGQVFRVNAVVATHDNTLTDQDDAASAVPSSAYSIVTLRGLDGGGLLDGTYVSSSRTKQRVLAGERFHLRPERRRVLRNDGLHYIDYAERYPVASFASVNNRQRVFASTGPVDNSFYSPQKRDITYGIGGVDDAEDADVILHGTATPSGQPGAGLHHSHEAGSMGEGFGTIGRGPSAHSAASRRMPRRVGRPPKARRFRRVWPPRRHQALPAGPRRGSPRRRRDLVGRALADPRCGRREPGGQSDSPGALPADADRFLQSGRECDRHSGEESWLLKAAGQFHPDDSAEPRVHRHGLKRARHNP
jgi:hypothetical protein